MTVHASDGYDKYEAGPIDTPHPCEYEDPEPNVFVEVTFSDGTRARWALVLDEEGEGTLDLDLTALLGQPDTLLT